MEKLLIVNRHFFPNFDSGGPVRSISNLIDVIHFNYDITVFTDATNLSDQSKNKKLNRWLNYYNKAKVYYNSNIANLFVLFFKKEFSKNNIIYLNSFFDFKYTILWLIYLRFFYKNRVKIVLAPRGELTVGAMRFKTKKKKLYLYLFNFLKFNKMIIFHFTSEQELKEAKLFINNMNYIVAPNMHEKVVKYKRIKKKEFSLIMIYLSRICEKKNLLIVLKALSLLDYKFEIVFNIYGPIESKKYWDLCLNEINTINSNKKNKIKINVFGALDRVGVAEAFDNAHAFILPTYSENYGHAIVESMKSGVITIISDQTPWGELSKHGGFVFKTDALLDYKNAIEECASYNQEDYDLKRKSIYNYISNELKINENLVKGMFDNV